VTAQEDVANQVNSCIAFQPGGGVEEKGEMSTSNGKALRASCRSRANRSIVNISLRKRVWQVTNMKKKLETRTNSFPLIMPDDT
jgi:hypothetical protein